jgi:hypothetical protein
MYDASDYLYPNRINRYAIGDRTPGLRRARDGSLTIDVQHGEPRSAEQRANWLPAPPGPFHLILRLYGPKPAAVSGRWRPASVVRVSRAPRVRIS